MLYKVWITEIIAKLNAEIRMLANHSAVRRFID